MDRKEGTKLANKFRLDAQRMVVLTRVPDSVIHYHEILTAFYQPVHVTKIFSGKLALGKGSDEFRPLLKNFPTISGLNALNSRQMRSGVPKPEIFVSYRNTKRSGLYRRRIKDSTWARIEPSTFDLLAQLANHSTIWLIELIDIYELHFDFLYVRTLKVL